MKKGIRRALIIISIVVLIIVFAGTLFFYLPSPSDYGTFLKLRETQLRMLEPYQPSERAVSKKFENYSMKLPALYAYMFKSGNLSLYLKSYESRKIDTATINQLEIGSGTGNFFDYTFMIRPRPVYNVPFFHGDALKALPGVTSALYMDFYSFDNTMSIDDFFGDQTEKIEQAMKLAAAYWKHEGFGELTPHLDPYKSKWRLEMVEPVKGTDEEKQEYYDTVEKCFSLYLDAYLISLERTNAVVDQTIINVNRDEIKNFVSILYEHDIAVRMGKMIFPESDFDTYFLDGFWGVGALE